MEDRVGPSHTVTMSYHGALVSEEHKKKFAFLQPFRIHQTSLALRKSLNKSTLRYPTLTLDVLPLLNIANQDHYDKMPGFNNIWIQEMLANKTGPAISDSTDYDWTTHPTSNTDFRNAFVLEDPLYSEDYSKGLLQQGCPTAGVLFESQVLRFKFKNFTHETTAGTLKSHTPLYLTVYCCKFTEPKHQEWTTAVGAEPVVTAEAPLLNSLKRGFVKKYPVQQIFADGESPTTTLIGEGQLRDEDNQGLDIGLQDNELFDSTLAVVSKKSFVLCAGQEMNIEYTMPKDQFMSYAYRDKAEPMFNYTANSTPNRVYWNPMIHRRGEYCFLVTFHGGLHGTTDTQNGNPESVTIEPAALGWYATQRIKYRMIRPYNTKARYLDAVREKDSLTFSAEVDIGDAS